jgi:TRAP-type C4-dicarboxylate transport system permease small subunit
MEEAEAFVFRKPPRTLEVAVKALAVLGGVIALTVAAVVVLSVLTRWLFSSPIPGDFELAQIGTATAVFAFLPYCQLVRGNIVVDTFTNRLPLRARTGIDGIWDLVYAAAMGLVAACLVRGTWDVYQSHEVSMVLRIPAWPGIAFGALCCALLALLALSSAINLMRGPS